MSSEFDAKEFIPGFTINSMGRFLREMSTRIDQTISNTVVSKKAIPDQDEL